MNSFGKISKFEWNRASNIKNLEGWLCKKHAPLPLTVIFASVLKFSLKQPSNMSSPNRLRLSAASPYSSILITVVVITQFSKFLEVGVYGAPSLKLFGKSVPPLPTAANLAVDGENDTLSTESHEYSRHLRKVLQEEKVNSTRFKLFLKVIYLKILT